ncbi:MAG: LysR family transcriptional regulator [Motiliproteus sp.]
MEIVNLRTFKAVVDEGGLNGASKKLNTVQSNITARIHKLENELDTKLFSLIGRQLRLTPSGQLLYKYAVDILQLEYQAASAISRGKGSYNLRIGTPETFAAVHLPLVLKELKQTHPEIKPKIFTATSSEQVTAVLNSKVDCAVVGNATSHSTLTSIPVVDEDLVIVSSLDGVYEPVLCVREEGCAYRQSALTWQQDAGRSDEEMMVMSSADGVLGCVAAGLGYTVIGKNMVVGSRYEKSLLIEDVSHGPAQINISMIYRKDTPLEAGILKLISLFTKKKSVDTGS